MKFTIAVYGPAQLDQEQMYLTGRVLQRHTPDVKQAYLYPDRTFPETAVQVMNDSEEAKAEGLTYSLVEVDERDPSYVEAKRKADLFDNLGKLAGYWQNASDQTIKIAQDDACHTFHLYVGKKMYWGGSIDECIMKAMNDYVPD